MPLTLQQLETHLWKAADILRGRIDSGEYKHYIFGLLFFKRLSDVWQEEYEEGFYPLMRTLQRSPILGQKECHLGVRFRRGEVPLEVVLDVSGPDAARLTPPLLAGSERDRVWWSTCGLRGRSVLSPAPASAMAVDPNSRGNRGSGRFSAPSTDVATGHRV